MKGNTVIAIIAYLLAIALVCTATGLLFGQRINIFQFTGLPDDVILPESMVIIYSITAFVVAILLFRKGSRFKGFVATMLLQAVTIIYLIVVAIDPFMMTQQDAGIAKSIIPIQICYNLLVMILAGAAIVYSGTRSTFA